MEGSRNKIIEILDMTGLDLSGHYHVKCKIIYFVKSEQQNS